MQFVIVHMSHHLIYPLEHITRHLTQTKLKPRHPHNKITRASIQVHIVVHLLKLVTAEKHTCSHILAQAYTLWTEFLTGRNEMEMLIYVFQKHNYLKAKHSAKWNIFLI